ncbi:MAG: deoxyribonuclease IV [Chloroflexota bacterium]
MKYFGAHMSISGGHQLAIDRALANEMTALQIVNKYQRQWNAAPIDPAAAEMFRERYAESGLHGLVAHDSYLINVGSPDPELWEKSRAALKDELERCDLLGVPYLVSHPGAHMGEGTEAGVARIAEAINRIHLELPDGEAEILLETTAGAGTVIGRTFEELAMIIDQVEDKDRIGVCFDTCHVFAAGYEIRNEADYKKTMKAFDETVGLEKLKAFHLNDSQNGLGTRKDRHAAIGEGEIGLEAFGFLVNDNRLAKVPGLRATPKDRDDDGNDMRNIATLTGLIRSKR